MAQIETLLKTDLKTGVHVTPLRGTLFSQDNMGNRIVVRVTEDGEPVALTGTITGYCVLQDGQTIVANQSNAGIRNGNEGWIVLPQLAYSVVGKIDIIIKLTANGIVTTIGACTGYVYKSQTDTEVVPSGTVIPDLATLEQAVANAQAATTAANTAATETSRVNIAQTKSGNVITITTTNRNGQNTSKTVKEPTAVVSKEENGPYHLTVTDANGTTIAEIPDVAADVVDKAYTDGVTAQKTALGNPIRIDDAVMAPLDKLTVKLEPKQDLHGYSKPWVGGAGKNLWSSDASFSKDDSTLYANIPLSLSAGTYTISGIFTSGDTDRNIVRVTFRDDTQVVSYANLNANNNARSNATVVLGADVTKVCIYGSSSTSDRYAFTARDFMIEAGSVATSYEPYENICPISGWDGVKVTDHGENVLDTVGKTYGYYLNSSGGNLSDSSFCFTDAIPVNEGELWVIEGQCKKESDSNRRIIGYYADNTYARQVAYKTVGAYEHYAMAFTIPAGVAFIRYSYSGNTTGSRPDIDQNPILARGNIYPVSLSAVSGSVYSGNLVLNRDGSGTVTVDKFQYTFDGNEAIDLLYQGTANALFRLNKMSKGGRLPAIPYYNAGLISSHLLENSDVISSGTEFGVRVYHSGANTYPFATVRFAEVLEWTEATQAASWLQAQATAGKPFQICYDLATPQTFNLTAAQVKTLTGLNHISCDAGEMEIVYRADKYAEKTDFLATLPRLTASGNPITLTNGADGTPLKRLSIRIDPKQSGSGTPSPSNIRPISGWDGVTVKRTGKNLLPIIQFASSTVSGVVWTNNQDGSMTASGTASANSYTDNSSTGRSIGVLPAGEYIVSARLADGSLSSVVNIRIGKGSSSALEGMGAGSIQFTADGTSDYKIALRVSSGVTVPSSHRVYLQLEKGSTATAYEPYKGEEFPIPFPPSIGTVYGANLVLEQDGSGTLTVDKTVHVFDGTENILLNSNSGQFKLTNTFGWLRTSSGGVGVCNMLVAGASGDYFFALSDQIYFGWAECEDVSAMKAKLASLNASGNPLVICFTLATPIVYHLTAPMVRTLLGYNNLISDAGAMEIGYYADPQMYMDGSKVEINDSATGTYTDTGVVWSANRTRREAKRKIPKINPAFIGGIVGGLVEEEWQGNKSYSSGTLVSVIEYAVDPDSGSTSPDLSIVTIYKAKKDSYNLDPDGERGSTAWDEILTLSLTDYQAYQSGTKAEYISNRAPIRTLDWAGNETLAGRLTAEGNIKTNGYLVIGSTTLSETQLKNLLALLGT